MQYRKDKSGNDLSVLGFGCMRFAKKNGRIDIDEAEREILEALDRLGAARDGIRQARSEQGE